jgi:hypothetical protein
MISEQENEWKRNLYKAKNYPLPPALESDPQNNPANDPPENLSSDSNPNDWKRELNQNRFAAQSALGAEDPPEEAEAMALSLPVSPFPVAPEDKGKEGTNPAAVAEKNLTQKIREGTAEALRQSWLNIIDSWGLTLFYIIFHFTMAYLGGPFSRYFPKPGREWIMKNLRKTPLPSKTKEWSTEVFGSALEIPEVIVFALIMGSILLQFLWYAFIFYVFTHPCEAVQALGGFFGLSGWIAQQLGKVGVCIL